MSDPPRETSDIQALLRRAIGLVDAAPAEAQALARQVLAARPGDPNASAVLSATLRAQGDIAGARAVIEPIAAAHGDAWPAQFERARVLVAMGRSRDATPVLERVTTLHPRLGAGWRLLGDIRLIAGEAGAAQAAYDRQLIASLPDDRPLQSAAAAFAEQRFDAAEAALRAILAGAPNSLAAAHLMAEVLGRRGLAEPAEQLLERCLQRAPTLLLARQAYALTLQRGGKFAEALGQFDLVLARDPGDVRSRAAKAALLTEVGDFETATAITAGLLGEFPDQPHGWIVQAHGLRTLGRPDDAIAAWRTAIALAPQSGEPYWNLANLKAYRFSADEQAAMAARLADAETQPDDRSLFAFALGQAAEHESLFSEAFAHYQQGNAIQHERRRYDADATTAQVRAAKALFDPAFLRERDGWGDPAKGPIFIVGLPRSGSTLVEQILASHPAVEGVGELMDIEAMARWIAALPPDAAGRSGYPDRIASLRPEELAQLGHDYLARTRPRRRLGRALFIDKAPWNWLHVGLIRLMLPEAKIIDVRRHPLACCFSAYKQHFAGGFDFAYDLTDLGRYYAGYVDLMAHFDRVEPGRIHRVFYERLVADTEAEVRSLLDYLQLPFDPACLRFFETRRPVSTPSSEQVRQPIFADAVDHWRNFEPWLGPLKHALGRALDAYPSAP